MPDIAKLNVVVAADTSDAEAGFARVSSGISSFASGATLALAGAGLAIGAAGAKAIEAAAGFEQTMSGVKAVSGATQEEMKQLSGLALQLGKDTSFSASEAGKGIEELVKGGLSVQDIMGGAAKATLNLAAAGGVSLPDAATIAANALAQFNLKGADMAHVADLIAGAANASALDVGQFKFSLQAAGAVASTVGFSFDGLATAIAVMGKAGITGSDAGTSLKTMFLNLQPSTKKATETMQELGILTKDGANAFFDAAGKVKSMSEVAGILEKATRDLTQQQKLQKLETIFGSDAIRAAAVFAKEGAAGFDTMAASMGKVTAEAVGNEKLNNLNGSLEQLKGSLETAAITLGLTFLPVLKKLTDGATGFINAAIPWIETHGPAMVAVFEDIVTAAGKVVTAFGETGLAGAMTALGGKEGVLRPAWERITGALKDFEPTGQRIERLLDTIGRTVTTIVQPALTWLADWAGKAGGEQGFVKSLANVTNAWSASIERQVDDVDKAVKAIKPYVEWLSKIGEAWAKLPFQGSNPFIPQLPSVTVGGAIGGAVGFVNGQPVRDSGGPGRAGQPYLIGTGAQPELFVPSSAGQFYPAGGYGGGTVVVPVSIDGREIVRATARIDERQRRRGVR